ncbi:MAG: carbamoyltransferase HypF [candidate division KSB1 bacterium]|nr:carbamoyltransferase HypF [candidate division KSB1 bacterium]
MDRVSGAGARPDGPRVRAVEITISGIVQGVGFRPFVYRLAREHGVRGRVRNTTLGVEIYAEAGDGTLETFVAELRRRHPPLAFVLDFRVRPAEVRGYADFQIEKSGPEETRTAMVPPDIATCEDCLQEVLDPADRRYRYPFANCTNCGPRFTITRDIPYDRANTSMSAFTMCDECRREYEDPLDRRFHAQPNACPACGPHLEVWDNLGYRLEGVEDPILFVAEQLREGKIVAVKGLGGYHLAVDAENEMAVRRLRERKGREEKPFAIMVRDLEAASQLVELDAAACELLRSPRRPIVLLPRRPDCPVAPSVAPHNAFLGIMLPYTPLHHLLLQEGFRALVMTSGNLSEEPICIANEEAVERLASLADLFLVHNRAILVRCDDSVIRWLPGGEFLPVRRARGFVPQPVVLPWPLRPVLAVGAELKNTVCLAAGTRATLSQHIGDLENLEALDFFQEAISHLRSILQIEPEVVAHDLHPDYLSTQWAEENFRPERRVGVQHHHAHVASCLAENGREGPVLGLALDGAGYGPDGTVWGGEVLLASLRGYRRVARFFPVPMPGGARCVREPWRMALACLWAVDPDLAEERGAEWLGVDPPHAGAVLASLRHSLNAPLTSSCGRLFDAVSALLGLRGRISYEGQAATELEMAMYRNRSPAEALAVSVEPYPYTVARNGDLWELDWRPLFQAVVTDRVAGEDPSEISLRFHRTLVLALADLTLRVREEERVDTVALTGGCFQNVYLSASLSAALREAGFEVLVHRLVPPNDGGIALGQAVVAGLLSN